MRVEREPSPITRMSGKCKGPEGIFSPPYNVSLTVYNDGTRKENCPSLTEGICIQADQPCTVFPETQRTNPLIDFGSGEKIYSINRHSGILQFPDGETTKLSPKEKALVMALVERQGKITSGEDLSRAIGVTKDTLYKLTQRIRQNCEDHKERSMIRGIRGRGQVTPGYEIPIYTGETPPNTGC